MNQPNISTFVGDLSSEMTPYKTYGKEQFYFTHMRCYGADIPVIMSRHFFEMYKGERVQIQAFPKKTRKRNRQDKTVAVVSFLEAVFVEPTDADKDKRYVKIEGRVSTSPNLRLGNNCTVILQFELEYLVNFTKPVAMQIDCVAYDEKARDMMDLKKGDYLKLKGYVAGYDKTMRVVATQNKRGVTV